jgi:hypothetical protein
MTDHNERPAPDLLDQAIKALREEPVPECPPAQVLASTVEALQTVGSPEILRLQQRRKVMIRIARYGSVALAAAILIAVGATFLLMHLSAPLAFGDLVENVKQAKAVSFVSKMPTILQGKERGILQQKFFVQDQAFRMEIPSAQEGANIPPDAPSVLMAVIADAKQKKALEIDFVRKAARFIQVDDKRWQEMARGLTNPIDKLRSLKNDDAEPLGEEILDGRKTQIYRLKKADFFMEVRFGKEDTAKLWADPKTGLPIRISVEGPTPDGKDKNFIIFDQFTWNEPLPAEMFKMEIPAGFTEKKN